jgi:hypothetical protein
MIKRGDRVKLTVRVAAAFNNSKRTHKFDWTDRRGVVERITANKAAAMVLWDGRKSVDDVRSVVLNWNQQSWDSPSKMQRGRGGIGKPLEIAGSRWNEHICSAAIDQQPARAVV